MPAVDLLSSFIPIGIFVLKLYNFTGILLSLLTMFFNPFVSMLNDPAYIAAQPFETIFMLSTLPDTDIVISLAVFETSAPFILITSSDISASASRIFICLSN